MTSFQPTYDGVQGIGCHINALDQDLWTSRQPLMDFMTHDMDTTLPGMLEDIWWGLPQMGM